MRPSALTIAGFDPSGGAGLQADLRVFASLGVAGWSVTTAITIQNTRGVHAVHPVDPSILRAQLDAVFSDARDLGAVKIGMLGGAAQARVVADALRRWRPRNVVLDPVLASSGGVPLLDDPAALDDLIPLCDLVTPNLNEPVKGRVVLLKGGHGSGDESIDVLIVDGVAVREFRAPRLNASLHGTGCRLSSAIAAHLALGAPLGTAIERAKELVTRELAAVVTPSVSEGPGGPGGAPPARPGASLTLGVTGVYVITDARRDPEETIRAAIDGGATVVQLREKTLATPQLIDLAKRIRDVTRGRALFIVNDRVDVALASGADGVHIGPDDMRPADVRRIVPDHFIVGVSVGTVEEGIAAAPFASYFGVGAIYGSATKHDAGDAVGLQRIRDIRAAFSRMPVIAIGGIGRETIAEVARSGAEGAAVVSAVVCADDMRQATAELVALWRGATS